MKRRLVLWGLWMGSTACQLPLAPCAPDVSVLGNWRYSGVQADPVPAQLSGILEVTSESCEGFKGRLDVVEVDGLQAGRRLAGPVTGRLLSGTSLRFDAYLATVPRQHLASLDADGVEGSWVAVGAGVTAPATGSFDARREAP